MRAHTSATLDSHIIYLILIAIAIAIVWCGVAFAHCAHDIQQKREFDHPPSKIELKGEPRKDNEKWPEKVKWMRSGSFGKGSKLCVCVEQKSFSFVLNVCQIF